MNILVISPISILPNTRGSTNRIISLVKSLNNEGANVTVLHAGDCGILNECIDLYGYPSFEKLVGLNKIEGRFLDRNIMAFNLFLFKYLDSICQKIRPDIVQFEFPVIIGSPFILRPSMSNVIKILDEHNVESLTSKTSSSTSFLYPYKFIMEKRAVNKANLILSVSYEDKQKLSDLYGIENRKIMVVPNGVNIEEYSNYNKKEIRLNLGIKESDVIVFFHGSMSWKPNLEAVNMIKSSIMPKVCAKNPDVFFYIAGEGSEKFTDLKNIKFLGYIKNLTEYIKSADLCIAPMLRGGGTSLKIFEYMAAKKPIITTDKGIRGIPIIHGKHALISNDLNDDFPKSILELIKSTNGDELGSEAYKLALKYDWNSIGKRLYSRYLKFIN